MLVMGVYFSSGITPGGQCQMRDGMPRGIHKEALTMLTALTCHYKLFMLENTMSQSGRSY